MGSQLITHNSQLGIAMSEALGSEDGAIEETLQQSAAPNVDSYVIGRLHLGLCSRFVLCPNSPPGWMD